MSDVLAVKHNQLDQFASVFPIRWLCSTSEVSPTTNLLILSYLYYL